MTEPKGAIVKKSTAYLAAASAIALISAASAAQADGVVLDTDLAAPGVYFGNGNLNGHFLVDTEQGVEIGLRAHVFQQNTTAPTGDVYSFNLGDVVSFDWSINPNVGGEPVSMEGVQALITVHDFVNNVTRSFPGIFPDTNTTSPLAPGGYQNSERLSFGFVDPLYNPNQSNTFSVNLQLTGVPSGTMSLTETITQGGGAVPEPATWALMILGFGSAGAALRRRRGALAATA